MKKFINRFKEFSRKRFNVTNIVIQNEFDPFEISLKCDFTAIGRISIESFSARYFSMFQEFYDGEYPEWGLSKQSRLSFDEHQSDFKTLSEIMHRVKSRQDARFVILTQNHIIGYILIEEIDCIQEGGHWGQP